ncbi:MAG TPA: hypothetical protein VJO34_09140, partial [Methylomirabilota bacterium]|nr:hypothetical protein [Methylomirabilota bacterium]
MRIVTLEHRVAPPVLLALAPDDLIHHSLRVKQRAELAHVLQPLPDTLHHRHRLAVPAQAGQVFGRRLLAGQQRVRRDEVQAPGTEAGAGQRAALQVQRQRGDLHRPQVDVDPVQVALDDQVRDLAL